MAGGPGVDPVAVEVATVADDEAVLFADDVVRRYLGLAPDTDHELDGTVVHTLARPPGELRCRIATVNDVHFGEDECGVIEGVPPGDDVFRTAPGDTPYPEVMNRAAVAEITAIDPAVVVAKGDLTNLGVRSEYDEFLACYGEAFGDRLVHVRGNHDAYRGETFAAWPTQLVEVPGARLAVLDTSIPGTDTGSLSDDQLTWLDDVARDAGVAGLPLLVFGHHHPWDPSSNDRSATYFGLHPDVSERLVAVAARRPAIAGYFAGHTHRNRVRRFAATGAMPWVEVACVKDYPGTWAEYRIYDGGVLQVHRRVTDPDALAWANTTRGMYGGLYPRYALGRLDDRCFGFSRR